MLVRIWERLSLCRKLDTVVVATSPDPSNDMIEAVCTREGIRCVRGGRDEADIVGRLLHAAEETSADAIVRISGDCSMVCPKLVDELIGIWRFSPRLDYVSTVFPRTFPDGMDAEVFSVECLRHLDVTMYANHPGETLYQYREELSRTIWKHPEDFRIGSLEHVPNVSHLRWTVDTDEDLEFAREVFARLPEGFTMEDILRVFNPDEFLRLVR